MAKVEEAKITEVNINKARESYRPAAIRGAHLYVLVGSQYIDLYYRYYLFTYYMIGALLYFLVDSLWILDHFYRYSMANFVIMFKKGMDLSGESDDVAQRVRNIIETACYTVFAYVAQGLFERHKLIFATVCSAPLRITIRTR